MFLKSFEIAKTVWNMNLKTQRLFKVRFMTYMIHCDDLEAATYMFSKK